MPTDVLCIDPAAMGRDHLLIVDGNDGSPGQADTAVDAVFNTAGNGGTAEVADKTDSGGH